MRPQPLPRSYLRARAKAARIPTPRNRAVRTARLADLLARYSPRAGKVLRGDRSVVKERP